MTETKSKPRTKQITIESALSDLENAEAALDKAKKEYSKVESQNKPKNMSLSECVNSFQAQTIKGVNERVKIEKIIRDALTKRK